MIEICQSAKMLTIVFEDFNQSLIIQLGDICENVNVTFMTDHCTIFDIPFVCLFFFFSDKVEVCHWTIFIPYLKDIIQTLSMNIVHYALNPCNVQDHYNRKFRNADQRCYFECFCLCDDKNLNQRSCYQTFYFIEYVSIKCYIFRVRMDGQTVR